MKLPRVAYFVPVLLVYFVGMFLDVMELDEAQYAELSREMLTSGSFLKLYFHGEDYLDKPPLLFWVSTLSFKLFGVSSFTYRLPSVLFTLLGLWATFRLGKRLYGDRVGFYAVLMLSSCQAWFMFNHDIRTDTILAACIVTAIWLIVDFLYTGRWIYWFCAGLALAGAMMTKGPIGLMAPGLAVCFHLAVRGEWRLHLLKWQWIAMLGITLLCLAPMLVGLYEQYDLHPGKVVNGETISSGIKFYFWTQSFGRITGESVWHDDSTPLFFTHTFLWAFLPWSLLFIIGWVQQTIALFFKKFAGLWSEKEGITWGGFVIPFIAFSLSHYKLPHYIYCLFPLAAVIAAAYWKNLLSQKSRRIISVLYHTHIVMGFLLFTLGALLCASFSESRFWVWSAWGGGLTAFGYVAFVNKVPRALRFFWAAWVSIVVLNFLLNVSFYPALSNYASHIKAAQFVRAQGGSDRLIAYKVDGGVGNSGIDFYSQRQIPWYDDWEALSGHVRRGETYWIYASKAGKEEIVQSNWLVIASILYPHYHISKLSIPFIRSSTRSERTTQYYLLQVRPL